MSETELVHVRHGALLHDIGKMGVPDPILLKPDPLTADEWVIMRQHPVFAYELLSPITFLRPALDIPYAHHERWDGGGYPRGLVGEAIPLAARVFAVVDVWDALRSDRPYRWTHAWWRPFWGCWAPGPSRLPVRRWACRAAGYFAKGRGGQLRPWLTDVQRAGFGRTPVSLTWRFAVYRYCCAHRHGRVRWAALSPRGLT
jgi:hypothetical protein